MPSRTEPFGFVDIEFAWSGCPTDGSLVGGRPPTSDPSVGQPRGLERLQVFGTIGYGREVILTILEINWLLRFLKLYQRAETKS
eukprot:scaffold69054_cov19-Cyclotella_meneghiniana.AAC.2